MDEQRTYLTVFFKAVRFSIWLPLVFLVVACISEAQPDASVVTLDPMRITKTPVTEVASQTAVLTTIPPLPTFTATPHLPTSTPDTLIDSEFEEIPPSTPRPPTRTPFPSPTTIPSPTIDPRTPIAPVPYYEGDPSLVLQEESVLNGYFIRRWCVLPEPPGSNVSRLLYCILTIEAEGKSRLEIGPVQWVDPLTGGDITGEGNPDLIMGVGPVYGTIFPSTIVYDLGDEPIEVLNTNNNRCHTEFEDLNNDGSLEAISCDSLFTYDYCPGITSESVNVKVIYQFVPGQGFTPANLQFTAQYSEDIAEQTQRAEDATPGGLFEFDNTTKCAVLGLVLSYLYSGQPEVAWEALEHYYTFPDIDTFRAEIETGINQSPLFVSATEEP